MPQGVGSVGSFSNLDWRQAARLIQPYLPGQIVWRGAFDTNPLVEYKRFNMVSHAGRLWLAVDGPLVDAVPGVDPRWELLAVTGAGDSRSRARWGGWR